MKAIYMNHHGLGRAVASRPATSSDKELPRWAPKRPGGCSLVSSEESQCTCRPRQPHPPRASSAWWTVHGVQTFTLLCKWTVLTTPKFLMEDPVLGPDTVFLFS